MVVEPAELELDSSLGAKARRTGYRIAQTTRADRTTRRLLSVLSALFGTAALAGIALGTGATDRRSMLSVDARMRFHDLSRLMGLATAALAAVVGLVALRWVVRMIVPAPPGEDVRLPATSDGETTVIRSTAVAAIVAAELAAIPGIEDPITRLDPTGTRVYARASLSPTGDARTARSQIEDHVLPRLAHAIGAEDLQLRVELRPTSDVGAGRVR